jgi:hypothetical protein
VPRRSRPRRSALLCVRPKSEDTRRGIHDEVNRYNPIYRDVRVLTLFTRVASFFCFGMTARGCVHCPPCAGACVDEE